MEYGVPERRKNKNDRRAKRRFTLYKKGGQHRSDAFILGENKQLNK